MSPHLPLAPVGSSATPVVASPGASDRARLVRRGLRLGYLGLVYNFLEAAVGVVAGLAAGSVSLVGFGVDAAIEFTSSLAALWRLHGDDQAHRRERIEGRALRIIGATLLGLALYVAWEAVWALRDGEAPAESWVGIALAGASLALMPLLARAKRQVALGLGSGALVVEAKQTSICAWLSGILLVGLSLNAVLGWWWADAAAALVMVPLIAKEGVDGLRGKDPCGGACGVGSFHTH